MPIKKSYAIIFIFFLLMFALNSLMPLYRDDYLAGLLWGTNERIHNFNEAMLSLLLYYEIHGGRVVSFFIQFIAMLHDKFYFNLLNAVMFPAMVALLVMHAKRTTKVFDDYKLIFASGAFMWLGLSHFGEVVIWLCGSVVYLWTGVFAALFLLPYNLALKGEFFKYRAINASVMFVLGAIAACSVENLTVTTSLIAVAVCVYLAKRKKCEFYLVAGALGSVLSSLIMLFAPGNFVRIEVDEDRGFLFHVLNLIPAYLEMILYLVPVLLLLAIAYRLLKQDLAQKLNLTQPDFKATKKSHFILIGLAIITLISYVSNQFMAVLLYKAITLIVLTPLGLTDDNTLSHLENTCLGAEEAFIYIFAVAFVYLKSVESLNATKAASHYPEISLKDVLSNYPEAKFAAAMFGLSFFNNLVMIGAPSFPGRALFSSSCIFIIGAISILTAKPVYEKIFNLPEGRILRRGGAVLTTVIAILTLLVMAEIHIEDAKRVAIIKEQLQEGKVKVVVERSKIDERKRVLRHIAYDDFSTGMTKDHFSRYYKILDIRLTD
ncbi:MAG: hypothetical protein IKN12_08870 [Selenomonadaceae bacterium]|nr:hypothetical protein [Selenomonadaceae bacterium]